jgi:hypothetical protein
MEPVAKPEEQSGRPGRKREYVVMERLGGIPSGLFVLAAIKYVALPL